jgi:hypothetical protein
VQLFICRLLQMPCSNRLTEASMGQGLHYPADHESVTQSVNPRRRGKACVHSSRNAPHKVEDLQLQMQSHFHATLQQSKRGRWEACHSACMRNLTAARYNTSLSSLILYLNLTGWLSFLLLAVHFGICNYAVFVPASGNIVPVL